MRKAILFDLDDTLTDRHASIARYARRFGIDFRDRLAGDDTSKVLTGLEPIWLKGRHPWPTGTPLPRHHIDRLTDVIVAVCEEATTK